ncbi:bifunctional ADP-dependent NAD(P)H-hydrate dehydratase/NAD(P)H-hydrate epimerase [Massilia sp. 9096]|uniref:bifunctional ADP-dependent NAD(P)H-hydrate dehydratase/NAD(P)H-hydrate epimerase n=1 Tax=Massilia sp. 9096 TaxID=1500894 RepID=UPI00068E3748|nr:bifunctional ADP-dependent NAD(P)H-hydrate dehydratase/NAD(P)H-hydrate epimerase [Massilia sp. 9096]
MDQPRSDQSSAGALYSVAEIRAIETESQARLAPGTLMRRAGEAASSMALELLAGAKGPVLVLAGPGNNGGDALECAANLADAGVELDLVLLVPDAPAPSPEAAQAMARARAATVRWVHQIDAGRGYRLALDGLFGIGLARALAGRARALVQQLDTLACPVLALDVPSGLDADTGAIVGHDGVAVRATHTLTFLGDKPGLHTADGCDHAGRVRVERLGVDPAQTAPPRAGMNAPALFRTQLRPRRQNSHKGSYGDVAVLGGAHGMAGALLLAARAALYAGAGKVFAAAIDPGLGVDPTHPEIMFRDAAGFAFEDRTAAAGPGMGDSAVATRVLAKALEASKALVLDADALNLIAASPDLQARVAARHEPAILTPHPLEAARLLGVTAAVIQADRLENARELAMRLNAVVVLKGAGSVIARPDGAVAINPTGNPGLATGGTGDVLAGLCAALLAQHWPAWEAALGAVWLHGAAADRLVADGVGPIGITAGELPAAIRAALNALVVDHQAR